MNFRDRLALYADIEGCWLWPGSTVKGGYGQVQWEGKSHRAHKLAYELLIGPVPDGLQLDHLCRRPPCFNPWHLDPVTCRENLLRGETFAALKVAQTHCIHGHAFTRANTYWSENGNKPRHRMCRECCRLRAIPLNAKRAEQMREYRTTHPDNHARGSVHYKWRTHCTAGHLLNEANVRIYNRPNGRRERFCVTCQREKRKSA